MVSRPAVVVVARSSLPLARTIADHLDGEVMEGAASLVDAFRVRRPVIALCAAGIVIRKLAPHLGRKEEDPPVVAVAEDGSVAVPLLGGHHGANALARMIADLLRGTAAITTASDARFGIALDDPPPGWSLANPEDHKSFAAALLDGARVRLLGKAPWLESLPQDPQGPLAIRITEAIAPGSDRELVYVPCTLALGVGCERGTSPEELIGLVTDTLGAHRLSQAAVAGVFSLDLKADEAAVTALGRALDVPVRFFSTEELRAESPRLQNPSEIVRREVGIAGVAEAAALAAAGPAATLVIPKTRSARATLAVARSPAPLVQLPGRARGHLSVVGLGPGCARRRSSGPPTGSVMASISTLPPISPAVRPSTAIRSALRRTASGMRLRSPAKAATLPFCAPAMPRSTAWRAWSRKCTTRPRPSPSTRLGPVSSSKTFPASRPSRPPRRPPAP